MSSPAVDAVIFDMDGTLLDSEPVYRQAFVNAGLDLDLPVTPALFDSLVGLSQAETRTRVRAACGVEFDYEQFSQLFIQHWEKQVSVSPTPLKPGLHEVLDWLDARQVPFGLATNSERVQVVRGFQPHGLLDRFAAVVAHDDVPNGKPAPDPYLEAAGRLAVAPANCVVMEDSNTGVQSALAAGMRVIVVPDLVVPDEHTRENALDIVTDLNQALNLLERIMT